MRTKFDGFTKHVLGLAAMAAGLGMVATPATAASFYPTYRVTSVYNLGYVALTGTAADREDAGRYFITATPGGLTTSAGVSEIRDPFIEPLPLATFFLGLTDLNPGGLDYDASADQHLVLALNNFGYGSVIGQEFSDAFEGFDEASLIDALFVVGTADTSQSVRDDAFGLLFSFGDYVHGLGYDFTITGALSEPFQLVAFSAGVDAGSGEAFGTLAPPVPEPATWAMMLAGFGVIGAVMRRRPVSAPRIA